MVRRHGDCAGLCEYGGYIRTRIPVARVQVVETTVRIPKTNGTSHGNNGMNNGTKVRTPATQVGAKATTVNMKRTKKRTDRNESTAAAAAPITDCNEYNAGLYNVSWCCTPQPSEWRKGRPAYAMGHRRGVPQGVLAGTHGYSAERHCTASGCSGSNGSCSSCVSARSFDGAACR